MKKKWVLQDAPWVLKGPGNEKIGNPWSRGNVVVSHAAGPGSTPGRINFLVEVFPQL